MASRGRQSEEKSRVMIWNLRRGVLALVALLGGISVSPAFLSAQFTQNPAAPADSLAPQGFEMPVRVILGVGYGERSDECFLCDNPKNNKSFTGYLSVGRPLGHGLGLSLDASFWMKGRPGTPGAVDENGVPTPSSLRNMLGNLSASVFLEVWRVYVHAGGGLAFGSQDLEMTAADGSMAVHAARGFGVGYSVGAGFTIPLASMAHLAVFGNYNVGSYDMVSNQGLTERGAKHEYLELGIGVGVG